MPEELRTNLRTLRPSRKRLRRGDVFVLGLPDGSFLFGRVVDVDRPRHRASMPGANLIYIYDVRSNAPSIEIDELTPDRLLLPPLFINRLPWSRGYFETIATRELRASDLLPADYFWEAVRSHHVDERGRPLATAPPAPAGDWGLHSFRTIDDAVSEVLGIPPAPDA